MFVGAMRPWKLRIPPGVAHGYKVVGTRIKSVGLCHEQDL